LDKVNMASYPRAVRAITLAFVIIAAHGSLQASFGIAAVSSVIQQSAIHAQDGPRDGSAGASQATATASAAAGSDTHNMADAAKRYLDHIFKDNPDSLQKVQEAWDKESGPGIAGVWAASAQARGHEQTQNSVHCTSPDSIDTTQVLPFCRRLMEAEARVCDSTICPCICQ
jgi:hypothetical protein